MVDMQGASGWRYCRTDACTDADAASQGSPSPGVGWRALAAPPGSPAIHVLKSWVVICGAKCSQCWILANMYS